MNRRPDRGPRPNRAIETSGKTVEDAVRAAQEQLGVSKEQLEIEIIEEGRGGFLGLGAREARIRARVRAAGPVRGPQVGRPTDRPPRRDVGTRDRSPRGEARPEAPADLRARVARGPRDEGRARDLGVPHGGGRGGRRPDNRRNDEGAGLEAPRGRSPIPPPRQPLSQPQDTRPEAPTPVSARREPLTPREASRAPRQGGRERELAEFTEGLLKRMEFAGGVSATFQDDCYNVSIDGGEDDGLLIGRGGETLDAIQHVLLKMAGRTEDGVQIKVDISGYRSRREDQLADKARELARQVLESGRGITVGPYKAAERRIVHRAVAEVTGVTTRALGDGLMKRILIEAGAGASGSDEADKRAGATARVNEGTAQPPAPPTLPSAGARPRPEPSPEPRKATYEEDGGARQRPRDEASDRGRRESGPARSDALSPSQPRPDAPSPSQPADSDWGRRPKVARGMKNRR